MALIYETENFLIESHDKPHVSREDGGHIKISPKAFFDNRTELPMDLAYELMKLSMIAGEAMTSVLRKNGIKIIRINYQENGNWAEAFLHKKNKLHWHLYGRAENAKVQKYPSSLYFPDPTTDYYDKFKPLTEEDATEIRNEIERLLLAEKYRES